MCVFTHTVVCVCRYIIYIYDYHIVDILYTCMIIYSVDILYTYMIIIVFVYINYIYIQDAAEVNAKRVEGLKSKGNAAFAQGDYQTAATQYSLACRLDPKKCSLFLLFSFLK
jgi:hypothetical protein